MNLTPDPTLISSEYGCSLIIGRSGSGKSFYVKSILRNIKKTEKKTKKIYTINVNSKEYTDEFSSTITPISLDQIKKIAKKSYVIVEDVISMKNAENEQLRKLINYYCHHSFLKIFIITHNIHKNGIYSLLSFVHYIVFTGTKSNLPILRLTLAYFKLESKDFEHLIAEFKSKTEIKTLKEQHYFIFDSKHMTFYSFKDDIYTNLTLENLTLQNKIDNKEKYQDRFGTFVEDFEEKVKANAIFSIIINCLPEHLIRLHDMTFSFQSVTFGCVTKIKRVSLVDYISCLLSETEVAPPEIKCLHNYLRASCCIPRIFVKNKQLK